MIDSELYTAIFRDIYFFKINERGIYIQLDLSQTELTTFLNEIPNLIPKQKQKKDSKILL
jgi:hypothetical protein